MLLLDYWKRLVEHSPDAPAVIDGETGETWSRVRLERAVDVWEAATVAGLALRGRKVLVAEPNGVGWFVVFLGLLRAGAIVVPADSTEPPEQLAKQADELNIGWLWRAGVLARCAERPAAARRSALCLVKLTSGSMGVPKARLFTHAQMVADGRQVCASMGIGENDLNLGLIPFGHSYGLGNLVMPLLVQGTPVLFCPSPLPNVISELCARWKPTVFPAVPTLLRALVAADVEPRALSSLRLVISAGALLAAETARAFREKFGCAVHGFYGSSETGGITFDRTGEATEKGAGVGTPMEGVRLRFGRGGRFWVESAAVMGRGRWRPPDRGQLAADGGLVLLGRVGRMVKIAGRRLDLTEVEASLRKLPGVRDAFAMAHPERMDALAAAVVADCSAEELKGLLRTRLAAWKIPARLLVLPEFPATERGKPDRKRLMALLGAR